MKNKLLKALSLVVIIFALIIIIIFINNYFCSLKLSRAIDSGDKAAVENIVEHNQACVNRIPALFPEWFYTFIDTTHSPYSLYHACLKDDIEIVETLIKAGANVNGAGGDIPLSAVYLNKNPHWYEISVMLIENGASVNYITDYSGGKISVLQDIISIALGDDSTDTPDDEDVYLAFVYALKHSDKNNIDWYKVCHECVSSDRVKIVELLMKEGFFKVNDDSEGMSLLMFAARDSTVEMVRFLLNHGADKSIISKEGKTAYDYAIERGNIDIIKLLK